MIGKCIWFNAKKGYGFLEDSATKNQFFVHFSAIRSNGYKELKADEAVEFDTEKGNSGKIQAANVVSLD